MVARRLGLAARRVVGSRESQAELLTPKIGLWRLSFLVDALICLLAHAILLWLRLRRLHTLILSTFRHGLREETLPSNYVSVSISRPFKLRNGRLSQRSGAPNVEPRGRATRVWVWVWVWPSGDCSGGRETGRETSSEDSLWLASDNFLARRGHRVACHRRRWDSRGTWSGINLGTEYDFPPIAFFVSQSESQGYYPC